MSSRAVEDTASPKVFFVCAWNGLGRTRRWYPEPADRERIAVTAFLQALKWREEHEDASKADLIVVLPRNRDRALSVHDLLVYSLGLGGHPKKVLYVHSGRETAFAEGRLTDWLFFVLRATCPLQELPLWLDEPTDLRFHNAQPYDLAAVEEWIEKSPKLLSRQLGDYLRSTSTCVQRLGEKSGVWKLGENEKEVLARRVDRLAVKTERRCELGSERQARTGQQLVCEGVAEPSRAKLFFGICRLADAHNRIEHDVNARLAREDGASAEDTLCDLTRLRVLQTCIDLRSAIAARYVATCRVAYRRCRRPVIWLIDDNPRRGGFDERLWQVLRSFLPDMTLVIWNPDDRTLRSVSAQPEGEYEPARLARTDLVDYSSWAQGGTPSLVKRWMQIQIRRGRNPHSRIVNLETLLARTCVILVDILFQDAHGNDREAGYGIIQGLWRLCRDYQKSIGKAWHLPEILAISRASDITKVHTAVRLGVGGYLVKERPLSVPGAIARALKPAIDDVSVAHRNFRALYGLPHETIGELRATEIPPIAFGRPPGIDDAEAKRATRNRQIRRSQPLAKLLAALPKTDLHVHPGSCMTPEYLVAASLVMLLRHELTKGNIKAFKETVRDLGNTLAGQPHFTLSKCPTVTDKREIGNFSGDPKGLAEFGLRIRNLLGKEVRAGNDNRESLSPDAAMEMRYRSLRSILHAAFKFPDHENSEGTLRAIKRLSDAKCFFFALRHCGGRWNTDLAVNGGTPMLDDDDLLRLYLLWLAGHSAYEGAKIVVRCGEAETEIPLKRWFREGDVHLETWCMLRSWFYESGGDAGPPCSRDELESTGWGLKVDEGTYPVFEVTLCDSELHSDFLADCPEPENDPNGQSTAHPIAWLIASGTRSSNLREYLEGCEYTGAEHLRHPFLMHLFAQQTVHEFVRHGVLYAELRTALSGFENRWLDFSFSDACACFGRAMGQAQQIARWHYIEKRAGRGQHGAIPRPAVADWLWGKRFKIDELYDPSVGEMADYRFPCKLSIVLTGKRHKSSRLLLREAGAGAVFHARPAKPATTAREFVMRAVDECRVVGFDLAGQEDEHPPQEFRNEYEQISRLHIPVTVHAGENAPSRFVESAILDLRARRLGHGLALAEDKDLLDRARDEGTCVELCPVSNFQTNAVYPYGDAGLGRQYPLATFLEKGLNVTINTDNPVISCTNMIKECFQAAYALGSKTLSLWDLLRILRSGFTQAFLTQPERRALLELADQLVFDLFSRPEIVDLLRTVSSARASRTPPRFDWSGYLDPAQVKPQDLRATPGIYAVIACDDSGQPITLPGEPAHCQMRGVVYVGLATAINTLRNRVPPLARAWRPNSKQKTHSHGSRKRYENDEDAKRMFGVQHVRIRLMELPPDVVAERQRLARVASDCDLSTNELCLALELQRAGHERFVDSEANAMQWFKRQYGYIPMLNGLPS